MPLTDTTDKETNRHVCLSVCVSDGVLTLKTGTAGEWNFQLWQFRWKVVKWVGLIFILCIPLHGRKWRALHWLWLSRPWGVEVDYRNLRLLYAPISIAVRLSVFWAALNKTPGHLLGHPNNMMSRGTAVHFKIIIIRHLYSAIMPLGGYKGAF